MSHPARHPLDKAIWTALHSRQAHFAEGGALAKRFPADVSPFVAAKNDTPEAAAALAGLVVAGDDASLLEAAPPQPPAGIVSTEKMCVQLVATALAKSGARAPASAIEPLSDADAAEMLALATLTRPGPFRTRTHTLGRFIGIRDGGRLVAMGGERLAVEGFTEVSALCTHPEHRGRGYGEALLRAVADRILGEGRTPFLHSYADNAGALALYEKLGFTFRADIVHAVWRRS
ncbi:MAG: GNAT family N-acetyltransferase [Hyphomonadaceae bacterium]|nr:GNAT family N-acetyltransferase [Hyphomonadaceae bacterium]